MTAASNQPGLTTERFEKALLYATQLHARQVRKGTAIPYVAHLLAVAAIVLEDGGSEDEAIAALLYDGARSLQCLDYAASFSTGRRN